MQRFVHNFDRPFLPKFIMPLELYHQKHHSRIKVATNSIVNGETQLKTSTILNGIHNLKKKTQNRWIRMRFIIILQKNTFQGVIHLYFYLTKYDYENTCLQKK